jgi:hypothetical protein
MKGQMTMDIDNRKFVLAFAATHDAEKEENPIDRWVKERAILHPDAVVPMRYLVPDWLDFWKHYLGGKYWEAAKETVQINSRLAKTLQRWAAPDWALEQGDLRSMRAYLPIVPSTAIDPETRRMEGSLRGIKLLNRGRMIGGYLGEPVNVVREAFDNSFKSKAKLHEERRARREKRRMEDLAITQAIQAGVSLDQSLAALQHVPDESMRTDVVKLFQWITKGYPASLRAIDPIFG